MKEITIKCNENFYVKEITFKSLPLSKPHLQAIGHILSNAKSTDGFEDLINEMRGNETFYEDLVVSMISTHKLSSELYELIYKLFKGHISVEATLEKSIYSDNPVPKHIYNEIHYKRNMEAF